MNENIRNFVENNDEMLQALVEGEQHDIRWMGKI